MQTASTRSADTAGLIVAMSVVAIDPSGWYAFVVLKWSAVAIAVGIGLWARLSDPYASRIPRRIGWLFAALLVVLATAALFGRDPLYAWIGTPERHLGVLTWCGFAASLAIGGGLNSSATRARFARWVSGATVFAGVYAVSELAGRAPLAVQTGTDRAGGPYGSASLFGAALCLLIPVSIAAAANDDESRMWRIVAGLGGFLGTVAVVATGTRAAWVGLSAAMLVAAIAPVVHRRRVGGRSMSMQRPLAMAALVLVAIAVGAIAVSLNDTNVTGRAAGGSSRVAEWEVGARIVAKHPVLGVGPEGYRTALADGVTAHYERIYGRAVLPDRAHNVVIDVAAAGGLLAAALYAALAGLVVVAAWLVIGRTVYGGRVAQGPEVQTLASATGHRSRSSMDDAAADGAGEHTAENSGLGPVAVQDVPTSASHESDTVLVGFGVAAIAYLVQQWFLFPVSTIDPIFWMLAGALVVAVWGETTGPAASEVPDIRHRRAWTNAACGIVVVALGVNAVFAVAADRAARVGVDHSDLRSAKRAVRLRPDVVRYRLLESQLEPASIAGRRAAIDDLAGALRVSPGDPIIAQAHAGAMLKLAIATGDQHDIDAARTTIRRLVDADANCYRCALMLGYSEALANNAAAARDAFARAAQLAKADDTEARDNLSQLDNMHTPATTTP